MTPATDAVREAIAREVKRVRFLDRYGNDYRADDERLDHIELDAADRIIALSEAASQPREGDEMAAMLNRLADENPGGGARLRAVDLRAIAAALTQRPPEQAGAVPAGMGDALSYIATHGELIGASRCVEVAQEALAVTASRCDTMLGNGPAYGQCTRPSGHPGNCSRHSFPPPPDAGPGEIPAGMVMGARVRDRGTGETGTIIRTPYIVQLDEEDGSQGAMGGTVGVIEYAADEIEALTPKAPPQTPPDAGIGSDGAGERV